MFIVALEGGEGSGKTSVITILEEKLKCIRDLNVIRTREPGGSKIAEKIRSVILDPDNKDICYRTEALLYAAAREQMYHEVIYPHSSEKTTIILLDRGIDSSIVYQGVVRGLGSKLISDYNQVKYPDVCFILDVDPEVGLRRAGEHKDMDRLELEGIEFHRKVNDAYRKLPELFEYSNRKFVNINVNNKSIDEIADIIFKWVYMAILQNMKGGNIIL